MPRYSYAWRRRRGEDLANAGYACARCQVEDQPFGTHSQLERAHLDGNRENDAPENVAVLCRVCHRRHDKVEWLAAYRAWLASERGRRADKNDAARPILLMLRFSGYFASCLCHCHPAFLRARERGSSFENVPEF